MPRPARPAPATSRPRSSWPPNSGPPRPLRPAPTLDPQPLARGYVCSTCHPWALEHPRRGGVRALMRGRGPVLQAELAVAAVSVDPLRRAGTGDPHLGGNMRDRTASATFHQASLPSHDNGALRCGTRVGPFTSPDAHESLPTTDRPLPFGIHNTTRRSTGGYGGGGRAMPVSLATARSLLDNLVIGRAAEYLHGPFLSGASRRRSRERPAGTDATAPAGRWFGCTTAEAISASHARTR